MNLRWKSFEKSTQSAALALIHASSQETKEYYKVKKDTWWRVNRLKILLRVFFWVGCGLAFYFSDEKHANIIIVGTFLWSVTLIFLQATSLYYHLCSPYYLLPLVLSPTSEEQMFKGLFRLYISEVHRMFYGFIVIYTAFALHCFPFLQALCVGVLLAAFQGAFIFSMALILFSLPFQRILQPTTVALQSSIWLLLVFCNNDFCLPLIRKICDTFLYIPPMGWAASLLFKNVHFSAIHQTSAIVISLCAFCLAPLAFSKIKNMFFETFKKEHDFSVLFSGCPAASSPEMPQKSAEEQQKMLNGRLLREKMNWKNDGLLKRAASVLLTEREQIVIEFLSAGRLPLSRIPLKMLGICILFVCASIFLREISLFFCFLAVILSVFVIYMPYTGLLPAGRNGIQSPFHALYPISTRELFLAILKINFLIYCVSIIFISIIVCVAFYANPIKGFSFVDILTKILLGGFLLLPAATMTRFVYSTNWRRNVISYISLFGAIIVILPLMILFVLAKSYTGIFLLWSVNSLIFLALTAWFLHGLNHGKTDWLPSSQKQEYF